MTADKSIVQEHIPGIENSTILHNGEAFRSSVEYILPRWYFCDYYQVIFVSAACFITFSYG